MRNIKKYFLLPAGLEQAKLTSEKHNIIREFFTKVLKIDEEIAR